MAEAAGTAGAGVREDGYKAAARRRGNAHGDSQACQRNANSRSDKPGPWPGLLQGQTWMQIPHP